MRIVILFVIALLSSILNASDQPSIDELRAQCQKEGGIVFSEKSPTPACDQFAQALEDEDRLELPVYQWNSTEGRFCLYNKEGDVTLCP